MLVELRELQSSGAIRGHHIKGLYYIAHRSLGLDNGYYIYLIENHGFDDYVFLMRYDNLDDEEMLI